MSVTTSAVAASSGSASAAATQYDPYLSIDYNEALDDVDSRFILNLPDSELATADRIFIQLEQAWWFYEDLLIDPRPGLMQSLPRFTTLKPFAKAMFDYSPRLRHMVPQFDRMWSEYIQYKRKISNYGCILLSADLQRIVLCQVYNGKSYTLPAGKINQGEDGPAAAARETYEETGFDPSCRAGITKDWLMQSPHKVTWNASLEERDMLTHHEEHQSRKQQGGGGGAGSGGKHRTCFVVAGVPDDFPFAPVCRKEVSNVEWFDLDNLPTPTFAVLPFIRPLRAWIRKQAATTSTSSSPARDTKNQRSGGKKSNTTSRGRSSRGRQSRDGQNVDVGEFTPFFADDGVTPFWGSNDGVAAAAAAVTIGSVASPQTMATTTPQMTIATVSEVAEAKSETTSAAAPTAAASSGSKKKKKSGSKLQERVASDSANDMAGRAASTTLPSPDIKIPTKDPVPAPNPVTGVTAAAAVVAVVAPGSKSQRPPQAMTTTLPAVSSRALQEAAASSRALQEAHKRNTDYIQQWVAQLPKPMGTPTMTPFKVDTEAIRRRVEEEQRSSASHTDNEKMIQQWLSNRLPRPAPTKHFGAAFRLDADAIMAQAERDVQLANLAATVSTNNGSA